MRKRFEQQMTIGRVAISDVEIPNKIRVGQLPALCLSLKEIFLSDYLSEQIFSVLEKRFFPINNHKGRPGMDLWQAFVLSQVRHCLNCSFEQLAHIANYDKLVRLIMGVENVQGFENQEFEFQTIFDNVSLIDEELLKDINDIIVEYGHQVLKKKEDEALKLKTDSFVVLTNVHFPTDYNLLWDSARKCLDMIVYFKKKHGIKGWRKTKNWYKELKNKMRSLGKSSSSGGKNKKEKLALTAQQYLTKANLLSKKIESSMDDFPVDDEADEMNKLALKSYLNLLNKFIDLLERRLIKGEQIPHSDKLFSIFEQYTEWITKGKLHPNVELGKKVAITTDQFGLIIDYVIMENQADSSILKQIIESLTQLHRIQSWSLDKGFWSKENKELLASKIEIPVLPKKGKCNKAEYAEEHKPLFKKLRNQHSAIESNINELEHRGLDRCPGRGYSSFKRYVGTAVCSYNLKKIGQYNLEHRRKQEEKLQLKLKQTA